MKESLRLLGVESSGLDFYGSNKLPELDDDEVIKEAEKINNLLLKEAFLRKIMDKRPFGHVKSKRYLAKLLKIKDPKYACQLIISASKAAPVDPKNYLMFAIVAADNQAWQVANSALEVSRWLCDQNDRETFNDIDLLSKLIQDRINNKDKDNSANEIWRGKSLYKYWVLQRLYLQSKIKDLVTYSYRLLNTYPEKIENYSSVHKALSLTEDKKIINDFANYVKDNLKSDEKNKNLYLGMAYFSLSEFDISIKHLNEVINKEPLHSNALFYLSLNYLAKNNLKGFISASARILPSSEAVFGALYFIYNAASKISIDSKVYPNQKKISLELSWIFERLIKIGQIELTVYLTNQLKELGYFKILPYLQLYLSHLYIKYNNVEFGEKLLEDCTDTEIHRLKSWIYRLRGQEDKAESELIKYRTSFKPSEDIGIHCQLVNLKLPEDIPDNINDVYLLIDDAYKQTNEIIRQLDLEYGLNAMTCIETGCQDCCTKTFPFISFIEFLYIKKWLDEQPIELQTKIKETSIQVVDMYKEKYKKDPPFLLGDNVDQKKEYPLDLQFDCPCLGDNKCNVYQVRPFTCRAYAFSSIDGVRYKGCNYFFEQFKSATKLTDVRKVVNMASFKDFAKKIDKKFLGESAIAPIPVWFAQSYEETLDKIKRAISCKLTT